MAIAVQSVAIAGESSNSVVITKPSGLVVGDLLVAIIHCNTNNTITAPSGWTLEYTITESDATGRLRVYSKVATSTETAASNFTWSASGTLAGTLYRIDGFSTDLALQGEVTGVDTDGNTTCNVSVSLSPVGTGNLLIIFGHVATTNAIDWGPASYAITGGTNPTWTQRQKIDYSNDLFFVADGIYNSATDISAISIGYTGLAPGTPTWTVGMVEIVAAQDASGTAALITSTPTVLTPTCGAGVSGTVSGIVENEPEIFAPTSTTEIGWTNETGTETTWTRE